jgi:hypothetical protein
LSCDILVANKRNVNSIGTRGQKHYKFWFWSVNIAAMQEKIITILLAKVYYCGNRTFAWPTLTTQYFSSWTHTLFLWLCTIAALINLNFRLKRLVLATTRKSKIQPASTWKKLTTTSKMIFPEPDKFQFSFKAIIFSGYLTLSLRVDVWMLSLLQLNSYKLQRTKCMHILQNMCTHSPTFL